MNDDVIEWKHFPCHWPFVRGIHRSPMDYPYKRQWGGALIFSLICALTNAWAHSRDADDLRRHRAHFDVNAMWCQCYFCKLNNTKIMYGNRILWKQNYCHLIFLWNKRVVDNLRNLRKISISIVYRGIMFTFLTWCKRLDIGKTQVLYVYAESRSLYNLGSCRSRLCAAQSWIMHDNANITSLGLVILHTCGSNPCSYVIPSTIYRTIIFKTNIFQRTESQRKILN